MKHTPQTINTNTCVLFVLFFSKISGKNGTYSAPLSQNSTQVNKNMTNKTIRITDLQ